MKLSEKIRRKALLELDPLYWGRIADKVAQLEAELDGMEQAWDDVMERERVALEQITILKAKLEAMLCGDCEKSMLHCECAYVLDDTTEWEKAKEAIRKAEESE